MPLLKKVMAEKTSALRDEVKALIKEHGDEVISEVTIKQAYGGMRGVKALVCDTSLVDPMTGLSVRGRHISELTDKLPEEVFYLLCTGELPDEPALANLQEQLVKRSEVPGYVWDVIRHMHAETHPMVILSAAIMTLQRDSVFTRRFAEGASKTEYWESTLEDALNLLAKLPAIAGGLYRIRFDKGDPISPLKAPDWAGRYAEAFGIDDPDGKFADLIRLYMVLHCDHEGGNVSANTCHTVGSALSDAYLAVSAGLNGLAGPLHGLANQICLRFILKIMERYNGVPTDEELIEYCWEVLKAGRVIPGYGHAVLRATDPRFTAFNEFGQRVCPDDEIFMIVNKMFKLIPDVLKEHGKAANPYPNVDAGSGCLLYHFGITEFSYYTVFFSVSRAMGMLAQLIINRALGTPITRPKSVTTEWIKEQVRKK
ncbi:MAG: citrate (Si)-synthase [Planctomycetes bacterium]|nr:citrate (Si)-synthase [Planctomycetota bacterium]